MYKLAIGLSVLYLVVWCVWFYLSKATKKIKVLMIIWGIMIFFLLLVVIYLMYLYWGPSYPTGGKYKPIEKSNATNYFKIMGHVDKNLVKKLNLSWVASYQTSNPACDIYDHGFARTRVSREIKQKYVTSVDKEGNYSIKIPIDKYQKGFCQWQLYNIYFTYGGLTSSNDISFYYDGDVKQKNNAAKSKTKTPLTISNNGYCSYDKKFGWVCSAKIDLKHDFKYSIIPLGRSYIAIVNYVFAGKNK